MTEIMKRPGQYPMIAISYKDDQDPFFEVNVMKSLDMIHKSATMKTIFQHIKDAKPGHVPANWPRLCNVLITPPIDRTYTTGVNDFGFAGAAGQKVFEAWRDGGKGMASSPKWLPSARHRQTHAPHPNTTQRAPKAAAPSATCSSPTAR
jgi:hypothetical protein